MTEQCDVLIVGAGPAGRALAFEFARQNFSVVIVDRNPFAKWEATYGTWIDDLDIRADFAELVQCFQKIWSEVRVVGKQEHRLTRQYGIFDNQLLQQHFAHEKIKYRAAQVESAEFGSDGLGVIKLSVGETINARAVFDCGGTHSSLLTRSSNHVGGFQSAYGIFIEPSAAVSPHTFTLMDWSTPDGADAALATFLYAFDLGNGIVLVEETSLVEREPIADTVLRDRLAQRFNSQLQQSEHKIEHVRIAMGGSLPVRAGGVVGFGAAAGFVHPVTGYSVAASFRATSRVAAAVGKALQRGETSHTVSQIGWNTVWPTSFLRTRALHDYGLVALSKLSTSDIQIFFDCFFSLPQNYWASYLRIDTPSRDIARNMTTLFWRLPLAIKIKLIKNSPLGVVKLLFPRRLL